jgi:hypothetical protein
MRTSRLGGLLPVPKLTSGTVGTQLASPWSRAVKCSAQSGKSSTQVQAKPLVGEDAAVFELEKQSLNSWALFAALLSGVSALLYVVSALFPPSACLRVVPPQRHLLVQIFMVPSALEQSTVESKRPSLTPLTCRAVAHLTPHLRPRPRASSADLGRPRHRRGR